VLVDARPDADGQVLGELTIPFSFVMFHDSPFSGTAVLSPSPAA
jgi:hypothetical protein